MNDRDEFIKGIGNRSAGVVKSLKANQRFGKYVDDTLSIPQPFIGSDDVKLIILGQDPTVGSKATRKKITHALMLNEDGVLTKFLSEVSRSLGIELRKHVYATNLCKSFFTDAPTKIKDVNLITETGSSWLPLLRDELAKFPDAPILGLGQPILRVILREDAYHDMKWFWQYDGERCQACSAAFRSVKPTETTIGRSFFPFIHFNSRGHELYKSRFDEYLAFIRQEMTQRGGT